MTIWWPALAVAAGSLAGAAAAAVFKRPDHALELLLPATCFCRLPRPGASAARHTLKRCCTDELAGDGV